MTGVQTWLFRSEKPHRGIGRKQKTKSVKSDKPSDKPVEKSESKLESVLGKFLSKLESLQSNIEEDEDEKPKSKPKTTKPKSKKSKLAWNLEKDLEDDEDLEDDKFNKLANALAKKLGVNLDEDLDEEEDEEDFFINHAKRDKSNMISQIMNRNEKRTKSKGVFNLKAIGAFKGYASDIDMNADEESLVTFISNNLDTPLDTRKIAKFERMLCAYLEQNFDNEEAQMALQWFGNRDGAIHRRSALHNSYELDELSSTGIAHLWSFVKIRKTLLRKVMWTLSTDADSKAKKLVKAYKA